MQQPMNALLTGAVATRRWFALLLDAFFRDRLFLHASALTYTTVLSIVPLLAVVFSVLKGLGFQRKEYIRTLLLSVMAGREPVVDHILSYIEITNVRTLGALGVIFLFITSVSLLASIEATFNAIWTVERGRTFARKITDYVSTILIVPSLAVAALSITASLQNTSFVHALLNNPLGGHASVFFLKLAPYLISWLVLVFLYLLMPNTRVRFLPAFASAVIAGTVWQLAQWLYIAFQIGATNFNAIYGSFAQLPLFLIWVYVSWVIVLLGAEMCFVFQNMNALESAKKFAEVSMEQRVQGALSLAVLLARRLEVGGKSLTQEQLQAGSGLPLVVIRRIMRALEAGDLVARLQDGRGPSYTLLRAPDGVRVLDVVDCLQREGAADLPPAKGEAARCIDEALGSLASLATESPHNRTLAELLQQSPLCDG